MDILELDLVPFRLSMFVSMDMSMFTLPVHDHHNDAL